MAQSDQGNTKFTACSIRLHPDLIKRVDELAAAGGLKRAGVIQAILEEVVPTVSGVAPRRGFDVAFRGGAANGVPPTPIKRGAGTPFEQAGGQ